MADHTPQTPRLAVVWGTAETTRYMVRDLLQARGGWKFTRNPALPAVALQWNAVKDIIWDSVLSGDCLANHAIARGGLVRKAELCRNLGRVPYLPETHTSFDIVEAGSEAESRARAFIEQLLDQDRNATAGGDAWVLKASESSNGHRIHPFRTLAEVWPHLQELCAQPRPWLLQRYVHRPLLMCGCKTHCRAYVSPVRHAAGACRLAPVSGDNICCATL